jgi:hypothetical protein
MGQQRPRSRETAPGLGSILPRRTASQKGISCSMRGSRSPWRGQDDRPRRSSRTPFSPPKHCLWPPDAASLLGGDHLARPTRPATKSSHASGDQKNPETARKTPFGIARPPQRIMAAFGIWLTLVLCQMSASPPQKRSFHNHFKNYPWEDRPPLLDRPWIDAAASFIIHASPSQMRRAGRQLNRCSIMDIEGDGCTVGPDSQSLK